MLDIVEHGEVLTVRILPYKVVVLVETFVSISHHNIYKIILLFINEYVRLFVCLLADIGIGQMRS